MVSATTNINTANIRKLHVRFQDFCVHARCPIHQAHPAKAHVHVQNAVVAQPTYTWNAGIDAMIRDRQNDCDWFHPAHRSER
jgi:hypothetical protein